MLSILVFLGLVSTLLPLVSSTQTELAPHQSPAVATPERSACQTTHIFLVRGWNEEYPGRQKALVDAICSGLSASDCGYEDVIFDDMKGSVYGVSIHEGVTAGKSQVTAYAKDCPEAKLVISGYSLGAHVVGDMLCGTGGDSIMYQTTEPEVDGFDSAETTPGSHPVLVFGDTRHTAGQPYNVETGADKNSGFPRSGTDLQKMGTYASVLRSYCVATDPVCAGGDDHATHLDYFQKFTNDAASWVRSMVGIENNTATATATVPSSSRVTSETSTAGPPATTGADAGASSATGTSSELPSSTETGASTTVTAAGAATATATSDNGVATLSRGMGLIWTGVMMGLCLLVGQ
ncbi:hypothetical protein SLS63_009979 [Diaporthe eres]|uniref:Cutinase n=1 Tax=Diaporthe eres TaxID=83184 RepID=A0ABR1NY29_DIAER